MATDLPSPLALARALAAVFRSGDAVDVRLVVSSDGWDVRCGPAVGREQYTARVPNDVCDYVRATRTVARRARASAELQNPTAKHFAVCAQDLLRDIRRQQTTE